MAATKPARLPTPFAHVLHQATVARLARNVSLDKGRAYAAEGRVLAVARKEKQIVAAVQGTAFYAVSLWVGEDGLGYICSCPSGADGAFCKHCVAVAVVWIEQNPPP